MVVGQYMNRYQDEYKRKLTDVHGALSRIPSGAVIGHSLCAMEPLTLLGNLHTLHGKAEDIRVVNLLEIGDHPYMLDPAYSDTFTIDSNFMMAAGRTSLKKRRTSFFPSNLHDVLSRYSAHRKPDVLLLSASPMDAHGFFRCSLCQIWERALLESVGLVLLEVNPHMPEVEGDTAVHISQVDWLLEVDTPVPTLARKPAGERDQTIGKYIATLINDGDTIQLGIGSIPDAVAHALQGKHDLGVHTEMLTNSIYDLVEAGVINGSKKTIHHGQMVATFALGDQKLYDMMHRNPSVQMLRGDHVVDPFVIAQNDNMVSVNTCISVDLTAQVNSESIGSVMYSGTGGGFDTSFGAIHAKNGRSIIALHATVKEGISTIVSALAPGAIVTIPRNNVDYVVTEYGIAHIKGRNVRERVQNLIAIAHPDFRSGLREDAEKYMLW
jgi:acyl-CoA hydrolase